MNRKINQRFFRTIAYSLLVMIGSFGCEEDRIFRTFEPPLPQVTDFWTDIHGNPPREGGRVIDIENSMILGEDNLEFVVTVNSNDNRKISQVIIEFQHLASPFEAFGVQTGFMTWDTVFVQTPDAEFTLTFKAGYLEMSKPYYNLLIPALFSIPVMGTNGCSIPDLSFQCKITCERINFRLTVYFDDGSSVVLAPMMFFTVFDSENCPFE